MAETSVNIQEQSDSTTISQIKPEDIHLPPPSYWPIILAFGFSCILTGFALSLSVTLAGVIITLVATIGWVIEPVHEEEH